MSLLLPVSGVKAACDALDESDVFDDYCRKFVSLYGVDACMSGGVPRVGRVPERSQSDGVCVNKDEREDICRAVSDGLFPVPEYEQGYANSGVRLSVEGEAVRLCWAWPPEARRIRADNGFVYMAWRRPDKTCTDLLPYLEDEAWWGYTMKELRRWFWVEPEQTQVLLSQFRCGELTQTQAILAILRLLLRRADSPEKVNA